MNKQPDDLGLIVAISVGAIVGVFFQKEIVTWGQRVVFVAIGVATGYYVTPLMMDWYDIKPDLLGAVGFLVGAFGGGFMSAIYKAIGNLDLLALVKSRIGGDGNQ